MLSTPIQVADIAAAILFHNHLRVSNGRAHPEVNNLHLLLCASSKFLELHFTLLSLKVVHLLNTHPILSLNIWLQFLFNYLSPIF